MPRFSAKVKGIHDAIWFYTDITRAKSLLRELKDPLDIAFAKSFIAHYYSMFQHLDEFLETLTVIENENERLKDKFIQFMVNYYYCKYYAGLNNPTVNKKQAEKYLDIIEQSFQDIDYKDDWEKYYCIGRFYDLKAFYAVAIKFDLSDAIKFQKKAIEGSFKIPTDREYYSGFFHTNLGIWYMLSGDFEEAEKSHIQALDVHKKYNNLFQYWPLGNLSELNFRKGDLQKAKEFNIQALDVAKRGNSIFLIFDSLTTKGFLSYQEGNYDDALKTYQESLVYRKQHGDPLQIFWGSNQIFHFYYQRFRISKDKGLLNQAEQTLSNLQELSKTHSDNETIVNYTNYAHSLILKHGNIRKKANAIDILEELIDAYPNYIGISLNLLELLFEDVMQSEDQDTIDQIDELMEKLREVPLRNNPQAIFGFISQQIFLAKYIYYIKNDVSVALNILHNATDHVKNFKLNNLEKVLGGEIQILENDIKKWENVEMSIKERIKISEFNKYIQEALIIADKQL